MEMTNPGYGKYEKTYSKPELVPEMPHSLADENYLISQMYFNTERADFIINQLETEDFFNAFNRKAFRVAKSLTESSIMISSHTLTEEIMREYKINEEDVPFDAPTVWELQNRYQSENQIFDREGVPGAIKRVKADRQYREIIYKAQDALIMAKSREGEPGDILAPLEDLSFDLQKKSAPVIVWANEAERQAQETYDLLDKGEIIATPSGFPEIDRQLYGGGFWAGDFVIVSGVTSGGKTTFALNLSINAAELNIPSLYFTMEMKTFKVFSRQHSARAKIPGYKIRPNMSNLYPGLKIREKLRDTGYEMSKLPIGYIDTVRDMESIRRITKFGIREYGIKQIKIDYLGLASPSKRFRGSPFERASVVAEQCKELAQECNISVVGLSQLRRKNSTEKKKGGDIDGNDVEPTLDMLKNSGDLENFADTVLFIWGEKGREGEQDAIRHIYGRCAKQRNGVIFPFELKFAPSIFTFSSIEALRELRQKMDAAGF